MVLFSLIPTKNHLSSTNPTRIKMIAQTKASPPISFSTLHDDILSEIAQIVKARISSEFLEIVGRKEKLMVRLDEEPDTYKEKSLWAYQQSENPILSSFQALSVANKRLYRICRPMLWEVSHNRILSSCRHFLYEVARSNLYILQSLSWLGFGTDSCLILYPPI